jgi:hypothetical protein
MIRPTLAATLVAGLALAATAPPAAAQSLDPYAAFPGYQRAEQDLGTWDAVLVARADGTRQTIRFVESNTAGCDGTCVRTQLESQTPHVRLSGASPWWARFPRPLGVGGAPGSDLGSGPQQGAFAPSSTPEIVVVVDTPKGPKAVMADPTPTRISVDYVSRDRRIVRLFGETPHGREVELLRIGYTRRAPSGAPSR